MQNPLRLPRKTTSKRPNVLRTRQFFTLLTSKCASRHKVVHFSYMSTSRSGPRMMCFVHFDLKMCFAPQRRALFWQLDLQKCSEPVSFLHFEMCFAPQGRALFRHVNFENGVFCTFWLGNVLRATTACTFLTARLAKVVWDCQFFLHFWLRNVLHLSSGQMAPHPPL